MLWSPVVMLVLAAMRSDLRILWFLWQRASTSAAVRCSVQDSSIAKLLFNRVCSSRYVNTTDRNSFSVEQCTNSAI